MSWTPEIYQSRIEDSAARTRHPAGSPSPEEIECYLAACEGADFSGTALVLGMTPELRTLAAGHFRKVISVDSSRVAIDLFADWLPGDLREKETVIHGSWADLGALVPQPCAVVFGDGIVGNLTDFATALPLLETIRSTLGTGGRCIMRNVVIGTGLDAGEFRFPKLLEDFRAGKIDAAEFGFCSRMLGFHDLAYDPQREILDCSEVYRSLDAMADAGLLSKTEVAALSRYRFIGRNYFPGEGNWSALLAAAGFGPPKTHRAGEKLWNGFYPVQSFFPI